jgi:hypothetical protein
MGRILAEYAVLLRKNKRKDEARALERRARSILENHAHENLTRHTVDIGDLQPGEGVAGQFRAR